MITLFIDGFWISPYALSAFVALEEKGLPYEVQPLFLNKKEHRTPEYQRRSLTGRVPALKDGDYWLSESMAITEYLAETYPFPKHPRIYPEDLKDRGRCRQLQGWLRSDLDAIRVERATTTLFYERATTPLSKAGQLAAERLLSVADELIAPGRSTLFDAWCIADADFALMLQRLHLNGHPVPAKVKDYCENNWARPSVRKWVDRRRAPYEPY
jgi:glutathione S-transferase